MKRNVWSVFLFVLLVLSLSLICGCGDSDDEADGDGTPDGDSIVDGDSDTDDVIDGDTSDGDSPLPDGDSTDGDTTDGDTTDGDTTDGDIADGDHTDGDMTDGDENPSQLGSISGTVFASNDYAGVRRIVFLYDENPYSDFSITPLKQIELAGSGNTAELYSFTELIGGQYYVMMRVDVGDDDDASNDVGAVYPDIVSIVPIDPQFRDIESVDLYIGLDNPEKGSISGTLMLSSAYQEKRVYLMAVEFKGVDESGNNIIDAWPSSVQFLNPAPDQMARSFSLTNLNGGNFFLMAIVDYGESLPLLGYYSPYGPYQISLDEREGQQSYTDEMFYIGVKDPNWGSISGIIELPAALPGKQVGVSLCSAQTVTPENPEEEPVEFCQAETILLVKNDGSTQLPYTLGNLQDGERYIVAALSVLDETHLTGAYYPKWYSAQYLEIGFDAQQQSDTVKRDWTGIDFQMPITEVSGTLTVTHSTFDSATPIWARVMFVEMEWDITWVPFSMETEITDVGGWADAVFSGSRANFSTTFTGFPIAGGNWNLAAFIGTSDTDPSLGYWCYPLGGSGSENSPVAVDGSQLQQNLNITIDGGSNPFDMKWYCQ